MVTYATTQQPGDLQYDCIVTGEDENAAGGRLTVIGYLWRSGKRSFYVTQHGKPAGANIDAIIGMIEHIDKLLTASKKEER